MPEPLEISKIDFNVDQRLGINDLKSKLIDKEIKIRNYRIIFVITISIISISAIAVYIRARSKKEKINH
jgi:hypothetical protein